MHSAHYYRQQAERARRLGRQSSGEVHETLIRLAQDFEEIVEDLEKGAVEIQHPEMLPQNQGQGRAD